MLQIPEEQLQNILINDGVIAKERFSSLLKEKNPNKHLADYLLGKKIITPEYYFTAISNFYNVPIAKFEGRNVSSEILNLIDKDFALEHRLSPFSKEADGSLNLAMEDPTDLATIEFLERKFEKKVNPYLVNPKDLASLFAMYGKRQVESFKNIIQENIKASLKLRGTKDISEIAAKGEIVSITDNLLSYALSTRASDIHIEALEKEVLVRYRIDGVLKEIIRMPKEIHPAIVARFKILSGTKLDEHTKPQDGRFRFESGEDFIDVRLSILPTLYGEKVEMRLLAPSSQVLSFTDLGMLPDTIDIISENIAKSYGVILVTGPTGSGKSTTLYSVLNILNKAEVNIITVEDPIEYDMKYINQTQINELAGVTFASALRAILRQDPNIIMVGEIRDQETAEISMNAALTGHLVLTSLHTNDAPAAIPRLLDMNVPPFLISAVVNMVMAQRLVRRLCLDCMYTYNTTPEIITLIEKQLKDMDMSDKVSVPKTLFKAEGCNSCNNSGYRGRIGIYEMLNITAKMRAYIIDPNFSLDSFKKLARSEGMRSMFEDGLIKASQGNTTIDEVLRVIKE